VSQEKVLLYLIKGELSEYPPEDQEKVNAAAEEIKAVLTKYPDHGAFALALVGAEAAAKD
jgi:hypothetical protein